MTKRTRLLLIVSVTLLIAAFAIKRVQLSEKVSMIVGLVELLLAIAIGVAFGLASRAEEK
jgi:NADH:ubiquinone oxidoreductase subunit K